VAKLAGRRELVKRDIFGLVSRMWIMVSGPYSSGGADEKQRQLNLDAMNEAALAVFRKGHVPIIGVNMALPVIEVAGQNSYEDIMMPISLALIDRCDACLRIGGASKGADEEADAFRARGLPVYLDASEIPAP